MIRGLFIAAAETAFSLANTQTPQPVYILRGVVAPTVLAAPRPRDRAKSFGDPQPVRRHRKGFGCFTNRECLPLH
jgi:hypothetical protein